MNQKIRLSWALNCGGDIKPKTKRPDKQKKKKGYFEKGSLKGVSIRLTVCEPSSSSAYRDERNTSLSLECG